MADVTYEVTIKEVPAREYIASATKDGKRVQASCTSSARGAVESLAAKLAGATRVTGGCSTAYAGGCPYRIVGRNWWPKGGADYQIVVTEPESARATAI